MIIKERQFQACSKCGTRKLVQDEVCGCDNCKKVIDFNAHDPYLEAIIYKRAGEADHLHFCSWECTLKKLRTVRCDYFIQLPFLLFDEDRERIQAKDFWKLIPKS